MPVIANSNGSVTVTFSITDTGNSGLNIARIVAVKNNFGVSRLQSTGIIDSVNVGNEIVTSPNLVGTSSYTFSVGTLEYYSPYFFYCACKDNQGWFNAPPGSISSLGTPGLILGTPIGNNNGRVYDPIPPVITIHKVIAIPSTTTSTSTLKVTYGIYESGNSGILSSRIMASLTNVTRDTVLSSTGSHVSDIGSSISTTEASGYITASYTSSFATSQLSQLISGPTLVFTNSVPLTITMTFQTTFVTKYTIGSGLQTQAPQDWTMTFFDSQDTQVGSVDTRNGEVFMDNQVRDFVISYSLVNVSKAVLRISNIPLLVSRPGVASFVNSTGLIQVAPENTPRYDHNPVTLAAKGLLVETSSYNLISGMAHWTTENSSKTTSVMITPFSDTGDQSVLVTANGLFNVHGISMKCSSHINIHTCSVYLRRGSNNFAQVSGIIKTVDPITGFVTYNGNYFVNFDLLNGVVGMFGSSITTPIMTPVGNGWFRCSFQYSGFMVLEVAIYVVSATNASFRQLNSLTTSIYAAALQIELGSTATSYIPTGIIPPNESRVTRAADVIKKDVGISFLRIYNGPVVDISSSVISLTGLSPWQNYRVFASVVDRQGLYDNGSINSGSTIANSFSISNNGGRTWDDSLPIINISNVSFVNPTVTNSIRVDVSITDLGSSGIQSATIFIREGSVGDPSDPKVSQNDIIFGVSGGERRHILTNTSSTYNNSIFAVFDLKESTSYRVFVAILDNQGNYDSSPASIGSNDEVVRVPLQVSGVSIPNGGVTYGLNPYFTTSNSSVFAQTQNLVTSVSITTGTTVFTHANTCEVYLILYPSSDPNLNNVSTSTSLYNAIQTGTIRDFRSKILSFVMYPSV